jgi:hypothetical protein
VFVGRSDGCREGFRAYAAMPIRLLIRPSAAAKGCSRLARSAKPMSPTTYPYAPLNRTQRFGASTRLPMKTLFDRAGACGQVRHTTRKSRSCAPAIPIAEPADPVSRDVGGDHGRLMSPRAACRIPEIL